MMVEVVVTGPLRHDTANQRGAVRNLAKLFGNSIAEASEIKILFDTACEWFEVEEDSVAETLTMRVMGFKEY